MRIKAQNANARAGMQVLNKGQIRVYLVKTAPRPRIIILDDGTDGTSNIELE